LSRHITPYFGVLVWDEGCSTEAPPGDWWQYFQSVGGSVRRVWSQWWWEWDDGKNEGSEIHQTRTLLRHWQREIPTSQEKTKVCHLFSLLLCVQAMKEGIHSGVAASGMCWRLCLAAVCVDWCIELL